MKKHQLTIPTLALIASTRGMLGAGLALLLANKLKEQQRKTFGWVLFTIGAVSTIPLAIRVLSNK